MGESIDLIVLATGKREQLSDEFFQPSGALALQDAFEGAIEGPDHHAGARRDSGDHGEEAYLVHGAPETAEPAGDEIADEAGAEPDTIVRVEDAINIVKTCSNHSRRFKA